MVNILHNSSNNHTLSNNDGEDHIIPHKNPHHPNNPIRPKKKKGLALSRFFRKKNHSPQPLCQQDSCSLEDDDEEEEGGDDDLEQDMSNSSSLSAYSGMSGSMMSDAYSHHTGTSDQENTHPSLHSQQQQQQKGSLSKTKSGTKGRRQRRTKKSKFIDVEHGELSDLNNPNTTTTTTTSSSSWKMTSLVSPSEITSMPLRKIPLGEQDGEAWYHAAMRGSDTNHTEEDGTNSSLNGGGATGTFLDLSMPPSFRDSEFDIHSFRTIGCNPFQPTTTVDTTSPSQGEEKNDGTPPSSSPTPQDCSGSMRMVPTPKKKGFLNHVKTTVERQLSKSKRERESGFPPKKSPPPSSSNNSTNMVTSSNPNNTTASINKEDEVNGNNKVAYHGETPKFTNKSIQSPSRTSTDNLNNNNNNSTMMTKQSNTTRITKSEAEKTIFTRSALSRPFGRTSLPSNLAKQWCVEVSPFYDEDSKCWKYHILVQREEYSHLHQHRSGNKPEDHPSSSPNSVMQPPHSSSTTISETQPPPEYNKSFAAANVTRTLKDIAWLERALRDEYHGALIFPALSMTLTSGTDWKTAVTLEKDTLERGDWDPYQLSNELLNVVLEEEEFQDSPRGNSSEEHPPAEKSPPFDPKLISDWFNDVLNGVRGKGEVILNYSRSRIVDVMHSESMECFLYKVNEPLVDLHFMTKKKSDTWLPFSLDFGKLTLSESRDENEDFPLVKGLMTFPVFCLSNISTTCNPTDQTSESETDSILSRRTKSRNKQRGMEYWQKTTLSENLKAQGYYIEMLCENALLAMYRLRILLDTESLVSVAWKRFAISLSNLFTASKDIESCKVGTSKGKKKTSKINKEKVDYSLRILARQKVDRATPSLKVLSAMLSAYYADFSSVNPSLQAYSDGVEKLEIEKASVTGNTDDNWKQALKAVSPLTLFTDTDESHDTHAVEMQIRVFEQRQSFNESLIKSSIMQLCNSIDIRVSRMSWKFFKIESGQATLLSNAADQVLHTLEFPDVVVDNPIVIGQEGEVDLVRRLLDLGLKKNYKYNPYPKSCSSSHTGSESDLVSENGSAFMDESVNDNVSTYNPQIEKLIAHINNCDGCWDSEAAVSILKMSGIDNVEIAIQDSTREVRTVKRLADSLQAQIDRCSEAISMLRQLAYGVSIQPTDNG